MRSIYLKNEQTKRILRVYILSKFYCDYRDIYLNECLLKHKNDYIGAEKTSDFINSVFGGETKPVDFIYQEQDLINDLISKNKLFNEEINMLEKLNIGINKKNIVAFCKNVEHRCFHILKSNIQFKYQCHSLYSYSMNNINKNELIKGMEQICIFSKKSKLNNKYFKKTFLEIEKTYYEIASKQIIRKLKNK